MRLRRVAPLAFAALPVLGACGSSSDDGGSRPPTSDAIRYELNAFARELSPDTLAALADLGPNDGVLRFHGSPAQLAGLKRGDVLVAGVSPTTPKGVLRQVLDVKTDGGDLVVPTLPAPIQLAFKSLHVRVTAPRTQLTGQPIRRVQGAGDERHLADDRVQLRARPGRRHRRPDRDDAGRRDVVDRDRRGDPGERAARALRRTTRTPPRTRRS